MAPSKNVQFSDEQKERLLNYMEEHREFAHGRFLGALGRQKLKEMWETLAGLLNSVGIGATKNVARWKATWSDWKLNTRAKASVIALYQRGTGGGEAPKKKLTPIEERLLDFMGHETVTGDPNTNELGYASDAEELPLDTFANALVEVVTQFDNPPSNVDATTIEVSAQIESVPSTSKGSQVDSTPRPQSPGGQRGCKRRNTVNDSGAKKWSSLDETSYDRAAEKFAVQEEKKAATMQDIAKSLSMIAEASMRRAAAEELKAAALAKIAEAKVAKYLRLN